MSQTSPYPPSLFSPTFSPPISPRFPHLTSVSLSRQPSLVGLLTSKKPPLSEESIPAKDSEKIWPGTYVAFSLSTKYLEASLDENSDAYKAVRDFVPGRYLGLVIASYTYPSSDDGEVVNELIVKFASRMAPSWPTAEPHWIPIFPVSTSEHQESALRTTLLFPTMDCKQWTTLGVRLRINRIHPSALVFELEHDDFARFEDTANDHDQLEFLAVKEDEAGNPPNLEIPPYAVPADVWLDIRTRGEDGDPLEFMDEISRLECVVEEYYCQGEHCIDNDQITTNVDTVVECLCSPCEQRELVHEITQSS